MSRLPPDPPRHHPSYTLELQQEGFHRAGSDVVCEVIGVHLQTVDGLEATLPTSVRSLDLSQNDLRTFSGLPRGTELRELKLSHNHLTYASLGRATHLERAYLSHNCLPTPGEALGGSVLRFLRTLHLASNALTTCEGLSTVCPGLVDVDLSSNALTTLAGLTPLRHCEVLRVANNPLTGEALPSLAISRGASLPALKDLDASRCTLTSLKGLEGALALHTLNVSFNALATLDIGVGGGGGLPALLELHASHNALTSLPSNLATLVPRLEVGDFSHNAFPHPNEGARGGASGGGAAAAGVLEPLRPLQGTLVQLYLQGNGEGEGGGAWRAAVKAALPSLPCFNDEWLEEEEEEEEEGEGEGLEGLEGGGRKKGVGGGGKSGGAMAMAAPLFKIAAKGAPPLRPVSAMGGSRARPSTASGGGAPSPKGKGGGMGGGGGGEEEGAAAAVVSRGLEEARQAISRMRAEVMKGVGVGVVGWGSLDTPPLIGRAGGPVGGRYASIISTTEEDLLAGVAVKPARKGLRDALQFGRGGKEEGQQQQQQQQLGGPRTPGGGGGKNKYASRAALALAAASKIEGGM